MISQKKTDLDQYESKWSQVITTPMYQYTVSILVLLSDMRVSSFRKGKWKKIMLGSATSRNVPFFSHWTHCKMSVCELSDKCYVHFVQNAVRISMSLMGGFNGAEKENIVQKTVWCPERPKIINTATLLEKIGYCRWPLTDSKALHVI